MSQCRLCGLKRKLIKAHVIPEAFFRVFRADGKTPLSVSNAEENPFPKRSPIGVYDEGILCLECEKKFGQVDGYGVEALLSKFNELFRPVIDRGNTVAYQAEDINQDLLLRFFVATLWRASVSTHTFYRRVSLGNYENVAKNVIDLSQIVPSVFGVVLSSWPAINSSKTITYGLMDPFREKYDGVNTYRVYFGQVVAYIRVDKRQFEKPLRDLALCSQDKVSIVVRDFETSKDFSVMARVAKQSHRRVQNIRAQSKK